MGAGLGEGETGNETGRARLEGGERLVGSEAESGTEKGSVQLWSLSNHAT